MKKIISVFFVILFVLNLTTVAFAIAPAHVQSVSILSEKVIVMRVGETITLNAVADAQGFNRAYMYWNTDDTDIVNLIGDKGTTENTSLISTATVKAINPGKAVINVYSDMDIVAEPEDYYENDSVIINVVSADDSFVSEVKPEFVWYDMYVGDELNIQAIAHTVGADFAYFDWAIDNETIIEVTGNYEAIPLSPSESTVTIKALSPGTTTVYVYADCSYPQTYKAVYSKITINVSENNGLVPFLSDIRHLNIKSESEKTIFVGEEISIAAIAEQDDYRREWAYFTWYSDDESVVTVDGDNGTRISTPPISIGKIKGVSEGTVIVTVFASATESGTSMQDSVTINVLPKEDDVYDVNFYSELPSENSEESDYIYHKIENLQANDIVIFPEIPEKENYVFTGWKVQSGSGIHYAEPQPFTTLDNDGKYYASWCLENEYEPIKIEISSSDSIIKGKENGKKLTLTTNYGIFSENITWTENWKIVGSDELAVENVTVIDDKTVELTLSGNSTERNSSADIYVEFNSSLLEPEPYEQDGEIIDWVHTKIKMDEDGVMAEWYRSDNAITLERQKRVNSGSGGGGGSTANSTVTFADGESKETVKVKQNAKVSEPEVPEKEGYVFDGWYTDKDYSVKYDFSAKVTRNFTLYAKWNEAEKTENTQITLTVGEKEAVVNGETKENDVAPMIKDDRAFLPARFVAESLGAEVLWDAETKTVTIQKDETEIILTIGEKAAEINGETVVSDAEPFLENDRTYTPIRLIAEALGAKVEWDEETKNITITK